MFKFEVTVLNQDEFNRLSHQEMALIDNILIDSDDVAIAKDRYGYLSKLNDRVYLLERHIEWEWNDVVDIFYHKSMADKKAEALRKTERCRDVHYEVYEVEINRASPTE
jgi:hypothetical protein